MASHLLNRPTVGRDLLPVHAGCPICGAVRDRLVAAGDDRRCAVCGSLTADRLMHAILENDLREEIEISGARALLLAVNDCQAERIFAAAEQYRCDSAEGPSVDLIAEPSDLTSLPDACFDLVAIGRHLVEREDLAAVLSEIHRVLMPGGRLLAPVPGAVDARQRFTPPPRQRFEFQVFRGVDPTTRASGEIQLGRKDAAPLGPQPAAPDELTGYAYHLSRKTGRRIVFCLDGPLSAGDQLPVESVTGDTVGHATVGSYAGGRADPPKPWAEGFRYPPRATFELDESFPSGVYVLNGKIPFVHRSARPASVAVLIPSYTAAAFNDAGGRSLYDTTDAPGADVLSFHRPLEPLVLLERTYPFVKWFASDNSDPEDTTYLTDADLEDPEALDDVEVLIVIGRSEYWTRKMREHFDAHVDRGGRALLLCSELMYWQVRVDHVRHRLFRYKGTDPHPDPLLRTTVWDHPSLKYPIYPSTGCELSHGGFSAVKDGVGWGGMRIMSPASPLLAGDHFKFGDVIKLPDASVWDGAPVNHNPDGSLRVDFGNSPPWRHEIVGYNLVKPAVGGELGHPATSLWLVLRRTAESGTVVHCGTLGWCGPCAVGLRNSNSHRIRAIISRMLTLLREDAWPFSDAVDPT